MPKALTQDSMLAVIARIPEVRLALANGVVIEFPGSAVAAAIQTSLYRHPDLLPSEADAPTTAGQASSVAAGEPSGEPMQSHALARLLLSQPDLPVATHAHNITYASAADGLATLKVGLLKHYAGEHIIIGDIAVRKLNAPNYFVTEMLHGDAPEEWRK